jgi:plastocyanin
MEAAMAAIVGSPAGTSDRVRRWPVTGDRSPAAVARVRSKADSSDWRIPVQLRHLTASAALVAAAAVPLAGCGGSGGSGNASAQSGGSARHAKPSGSSHAKASSGTTSLGIANFKFAPASVTVRRGTRITVTNKDTTAHTATADDGHSFDTGDIDPGATATVTLSKAGTYEFHCSIHPFMHGTLVVR